MTEHSSNYKIITLASLGGALEFFDFTIYALFARYISVAFFPQQNHLIALLNTFAIFALGYFARPLGGVIFGHFGDRYGRKRLFTLSVFIMAFATLLMGCLPTYQQIGILAPLLLLIFRLLQGISVGGEIPGATIFTMEHLNAHRVGFAVGLIFMGVTLGNVIGGGLGYILTHLLNTQQMATWGWRIPFIIGFLLGFIAYLLRKKTLETPIFSELLRNNKLHRIPALKLIQTAGSKLLIGISLTAFSAATIFLFLYIPSYLPAESHYTANNLYLFNSISFFVLATLSAVFGFCSDYMNPKFLLGLGAFLAIILGYFIFTHLLLRGFNYLLIFGICTATIAAITNGCYGRIIAEIFPAELRYSGMAISYNIGFALFGGIAPFIMTWLLTLIHGTSALYLFWLVCAGITLLGATAVGAIRISARVTAIRT